MSNTTDLERETVQLLADYELTTIPGLLRLITWNRKRRDLLKRSGLTCNDFTAHLADYDLVPQEILGREAWEQKRQRLLAMAKAEGKEWIPF